MFILLEVILSSEEIELEKIKQEKISLNILKEKNQRMLEKVIFFIYN